MARPLPLGRIIGTTGAVLLSLFVLVSAIWPSAFVHGQHPSPSLTAVQAVEQQLSALRANSGDDQGIAIAFRFASPVNRAQTGPVTRFAAVLRSDRYAPMLNHVESSLGRVVRHGNISYLPVVITDGLGNNFAFLWVLSLQTKGHCRSCWMTDRVIPLGTLPQLRFA